MGEHIGCTGLSRREASGTRSVHAWEAQSWAAAFSTDPAMAGVGEAVAGLRARGVEFPEPSTQDIVLTSSQVG